MITWSLKIKSVDRYLTCKESLELGYMQLWLSNSSTNFVCPPVSISACLWACLFGSVYYFHTRPSVSRPTYAFIHSGKLCIATLQETWSEALPVQLQPKIIREMTSVMCRKEESYLGAAYATSVLFNFLSSRTGNLERRSCAGLCTKILF